MTTSPNLAYFIPDEAAINARTRRIIAGFVFALALAQASFASALLMRIYGNGNSHAATFYLFDQITPFNISFFFFFYPSCSLLIAISSYALLRARKGLRLLQLTIVFLMLGLITSAVVQQIYLDPSDIYQLVGHTVFRFHGQITRRIVVVQLSLLLFAFPTLVWTSLAFPSSKMKNIQIQLYVWLSGIVAVALLSGMAIALNFDRYLDHLFRIVTGSYSSANAFTRFGDGSATFGSHPMIIFTGFAALLALPRNPRAVKLVRLCCLLITSIGIFVLLAELVTLALDTKGWLVRSTFSTVNSRHYELSASLLVLRCALYISPALCTYLFLSRPDIARLFTKHPSTHS